MARQIAGLLLLFCGFLNCSPVNGQTCDCDSLGTQLKEQVSRADNLDSKLKKLEVTLVSQSIEVAVQGAVNTELKEEIEIQTNTTYSLLHLLVTGGLPDNENLAELNITELLNQLNMTGIQGIPGKDGRNGTDGRDGRDGIPGLSGLKGSPGNPGRPGLDGFSGLKGEKGDAGNLGFPGRDGIPGLKGEKGSRGLDGSVTKSGGVYTRWGRDECGSDSSLLYKGFAGSSDNADTGGGVNYQCLPVNPEYGNYSNDGFKGSSIRGTEYKSYTTGIFSRSTCDENVRCARCYTKTRPAVMMIPAKRFCLAGWTKEYEGYLMTEKWDHAHPATYECVDANPKRIPGLNKDNGGATFHFVRADCSGYGTVGHCPPYDAKKEVTCVVCSK